MTVKLRRWNSHPGVQVADDKQDVRIGDDLSRVGDADIRLGLVVEGYDFDLGLTTRS